MAVVFISPKKRQQTFFVAITVGFFLLIAFISLSVFLVQPPEPIPTLVFNKPKVTINMDIFDTDQFKNLVPFSQMQIQFSYTGSDATGNIVTGFISAASQEDAVSILQGTGITVSSIQQAAIGRDNPFTPYYQSTTNITQPSK